MITDWEKTFLSMFVKPYLIQIVKSKNDRTIIKTKLKRSLVLKNRML